MKAIRPVINKGLLFFVVLGLSACAGIQEVSKGMTGSVLEDELPRVVAVMPFQNETEEIGIANQVRKTFYNHFSSKPYRDVELTIVDEKVIHLEKSSEKNILELTPVEICKEIGCDGLIYGKVTEYTKMYAGLYSQLGAGAEIWMVNAKTGKEVFRVRDSVTYHGGTIPTSPLGMIISGVSTAMNISDIQQMRLINELSHKLNERIPSPSGMAIEDRPAIKEVLTNAKESPFGKGRTIKVGLEGEKGMVATFDIGNFKKGILMKETQAGIYVGEYLVMPGDNTKDMPLIASLKRPGGYENQWIDVSGVVAIDTIPPPPVSGLRARGFHDRIEITWESTKGMPDLKEYRILKSEQPLSGYREIGKAENPLYEDKSIEPGIFYYYKTVAVDMAGNESEFTDPVRASLIPELPVVLTGELKKDTVLTGSYVINDSLVVPKGIALTIDPDTRIVFGEKASLVVNGTLTVDGRGSPVEFLASGEKQWEGLWIEDGKVSMDGFRIRDAETAIYARNSDGHVKNGFVSDNTLGINISGTPSVMLTNITVSNNDTGIIFEKTDARISGSNVFQNEKGIVLKSFSGEIHENNIFDNEVNILSESLVKVGANYLGSTAAEELRVSGVGVSKVYDNKFPHGQVVAVVANPYTILSQEDRQKKVAELMAEAGSYFRQRNYGKAAVLFEEALKAQQSPDAYYYLAL